MHGAISTTIAHAGCWRHHHVAGTLHFPEKRNRVCVIQLSAVSPFPFFSIAPCGPRPSGLGCCLVWAHAGQRIGSTMAARRASRMRKEYLYRKSLEGKEKAEYERKVKIREAMAGEGESSSTRKSCSAPTRAPAFFLCSWQGFAL